MIVISAANFASAILIEAGLSFLGLGVQPPVPSWGSMIKENYAFIILDSPYLAILPGIAIMLMVLAFMLTGNALRDAQDVKLSGHKTWCYGLTDLLGQQIIHFKWDIAHSVHAGPSEISFYFKKSFSNSKKSTTFAPQIQARSKLLKIKHLCQQE